MYSKNDYRYYLEYRIAEDNYLAHYGVKGMKWKHHKKTASDALNTIGSKISDTYDAASNKTTDAYDAAKSFSAKTSKKVKKNAKKAYKYVDDHVDGYAYTSRTDTRTSRTRKAGAGVTVKTKKGDTSVGLYGRTDSIKTKKGRTVPIGADVGVEGARDNKKKRKISYRSAGLGNVGPIPVYTYRRGSKKY